MKKKCETCAHGKGTHYWVRTDVDEKGREYKIKAKTLGYPCNQCDCKEFVYHGPEEVKSGVGNIAKFIKARQIVDMVRDAPSFTYVLDVDKKSLRDRALLALLALTGLRISEALSIDVNQFENTETSYWITNVKILKRREEHILQDFILPKKGIFGYLTALVMEHKATKKKGKLFDINRVTAWRIINHMTGFWCHYFRSQRLSHLVNKFRSTVMVSDMQGIKSPATISHYYKGDTRRNEKELSEE